MALTTSCGITIKATRRLFIKQIILNMENPTFQVIDGKLVIPEGVTAIEEQLDSFYRDAIGDYHFFKELILPDSLQEFPEDAFKKLTSLVEVTIPAHLVSSFDKYFKGCSHIKTIIIRANHPDLDFYLWDSSDYKSLFIQGKPTIRIEGEIKSLRMCEKFYKKNYQASQYKFYINNFIENVNVIGSDKWTDKDLFFRAPTANTLPVEGKIAEFTLSPYDVDSDGKKERTPHERWSTPIAISSDAVTYVKECKIPCYEDEEHIGTYLLLLGHRLEDIDFEKLRGDRIYPHVIVWESYDFVIEKLKKAGWNG